MEISPRSPIDEEVAALITAWTIRMWMVLEAGYGDRQRFGASWHMALD
jgi:hypothetical protein